MARGKSWGKLRMWKHNVDGHYAKRRTSISWWSKSQFYINLIRASMICRKISPSSATRNGNFPFFKIAVSAQFFTFSAYNQFTLSNYWILAWLRSAEGERVCGRVSILSAKSTNCRRDWCGRCYYFFHRFMLLNCDLWFSHWSRERNLDSAKGKLGAVYNEL